VTAACILSSHLNVTPNFYVNYTTPQNILFPIPELKDTSLSLTTVWHMTPKNLYFRGFGGSKTISSYSFDRIVLIFGYIVERNNTKILSSHFFQFPSWTQIIINDVISGFAKVVVERCGFRHWIAQRISWGDVVSDFLYRLQFPS